MRDILGAVTRCAELGSPVAAKLEARLYSLEAELCHHSTVLGGPHVLNPHVRSLEALLDVLVAAALRAVMAALLKHHIVSTFLEPY